MTKSGISRLRFFALSLLIAMSSQAAALADQASGPAVNSNLVAPVNGATTPQAAPNAARAVSATAPPLAPAADATASAETKVSPAVLTNDGIRAIADGRYSDAIQVLEQAMMLDATNATTRSNLTMAYNDLALQQAKTDQQLAMRTLRKSLTLNPKQTLALQNFDSMVRFFGRDPASFDDRVELANLARQDRDIAGVIYEYKAALAIRKDANVADLLKEALGPQKVYPVRPPRPAVSVQPNAGAPQNAPKPGAPNATPGASAPVPAPAVAPAQPAAGPGVAPAAVPVEAVPAATPLVTPDGANSSTRSNPNPN